MNPGRRPSSRAGGTGSEGARRLTGVDGWGQFLLLAVLTGFVGSVVGSERALLPLIGVRQFHLSHYSAVLSFLVGFGVAKALANLAAGWLADRLGRRRVLLAGWLVGLPEPILIMAAPDWRWVVVANVLLGLQQGLCWTTLISMMLDRARPGSRGLATGVNEFAGYVGVAALAFSGGYLASAYGLRPVPFLPGLVFLIAGLGVTWLLVSDTRSARSTAGPMPSLHRVPALIIASQAGLAANFVDAMVWGLLPLYLAAHGLGIVQIGIIAGAYPLIWASAQLITGPISDRFGRRIPITIGMAGQGLAIFGFILLSGYPSWMAAALLVGLCRAFAYPTLLALVGDSVGAEWRASALGTYRLFRDSGLVLGALLGGVIADGIGIPSALTLAAVLALISGGLVFARLRSGSTASDAVAEVDGARAEAPGLEELEIQV